MQKYYPVIIDSGSDTIKAGLGDQQAPRLCFSSLLGQLKVPSPTESQNRLHCGEEAYQLSKKGKLNYRYPIKQGRVQNWEDMTSIWRYCFDKLQVNPAQHKVVLAETPRNSHQDREKTAEIMFETFQIPSLYLGVQAVFALYSSGRSTGLVLDSGDGITNAVPVVEGYFVPHTVQRTNIGGRDITNYLRQLLLKDGHNFSTFREIQDIKKLKEQRCIVSLSSQSIRTRMGIKLKAQMYQNNLIANYQMEDRFQQILKNRDVPKLCFIPLHNLIASSISKCKEQNKRDLYNSIVLCGGNTKLPNFDERLRKQLQKIVPLNLHYHIKISAPEFRIFYPWLGGQIFSTFPAGQFWITKSEYQEHGKQIVHRK